MDTSHCPVMFVVGAWPRFQMAFVSVGVLVVEFEIGKSRGE